MVEPSTYYAVGMYNFHACIKSRIDLKIIHPQLTSIDVDFSIVYNLVASDIKTNIENFVHLIIKAFS